MANKFGYKGELCPTGTWSQETDSLFDIFERACVLLCQADRLIIEAAHLSGPDRSERLAFDWLIDIQLEEVDDLIDRFEADMPASFDAVIALTALLFAVSDPYDSLADHRFLRGVSTGLERWLSEAPDSPTRDWIEYLMNRPHVLHAELEQAWVPDDPPPSPKP